MKIGKHNLTFNRILLILGLIVALLIPVLVAYNISKSEFKLFKKQEAITAVKAFIGDLEKIKNLVPSDPILSECLKKYTDEEFTQSYNACFL